MVLCIHLKAGSQNRSIDSLNRLIEISQPDSNKVKILNSLSSLYSGNADDKSLKYASEALNLAESLNYKRGISSAFINLGNLYTGHRNYSKSIEFYLKSLEIEKELGDKKRIANRLTLIAYIHRINQNPQKSLEFHLEALKISKELNNIQGISASLFELKLLYELNFKNSKKAIFYCKELLQYRKKEKNTHLIIFTLKELAKLYAKEKDLINAMRFMNEALTLSKTSLDVNNEMQTKWALGDIYYENGNYKLALQYYLDAYSLPADDYKMVLASDIGETFFMLKDYSNSLKYLTVGLDSAGDNIHLKKDIYKIMSEVYFQKHDYYLAYNYLHKFTNLKDSISNSQSRKEEITKVAESQKQFDFLQIEKEHEKKTRESEIIHAAEVKQQRIYIGASFLIILIVALFAFMLNKKYKSSQQDKKIIELKNKEIIDSIRYAKRIQSSMLPTEKYINKSINNKI